MSKAWTLAQHLSYSKDPRDRLAADELRRLHEVNAELVEALHQIIDLPEDSRIHYKVARRALDKATGEQHG